MVHLSMIFVAGTIFKNRRNIRKKGITWISRPVLNIFSWKFADWWKTIVPKVCFSQICWKNQFFGISSRFSHYFFDFCSKMCFSNAQNMAKSDFREKISVSADFLWHFSTFRCSFSHKSFNDIVFSFVRLSVLSLTAFLGIGSLVFPDFWHKVAKW